MNKFDEENIKVTFGEEADFVLKCFSVFIGSEDGQVYNSR